MKHVYATRIKDYIHVEEEILTVIYATRLLHFLFSFLIQWTHELNFT